MGWFGRKKKGAQREGTRASFVHSRNMHLKVAAPQGEGWKVMEAGGGGALLAAFKCLYGEPPDALALDAMLYGPQEGAALPTLERLRERDHEAHFRGKMFAEIDDVTVREVEHRARGGGFVDRGIEVEVRGRLREPDMPLVLRERQVPLTNRLLLVSAAGAPEQHEALAQLIDTWLSHAALGER